MSLTEPLQVRARTGGLCVSISIWSLTRGGCRHGHLTEAQRLISKVISYPVTIPSRMAPKSTCFPAQKRCSAGWTRRWEGEALGKRGNNIFFLKNLSLHKTPPSFPFLKSNSSSSFPFFSATSQKWFVHPDNLLILFPREQIINRSYSQHGTNRCGVPLSGHRPLMLASLV